MLLTPLLSVSALAVPPLAQAIHLSSSNTHQPTQLQNPHRLPYTFRRVRQVGTQPVSFPLRLNHRVEDADDEELSATPEWPPPPPKESFASSNILRRNNPTTRNGRDLKNAFPAQLPINYNVKQESIARTSSIHSLRVEHQNHLRDVLIPQKQATQNHFHHGGGSTSVYSVKNQVSSHVSHSISHNYSSYVRNSSVFVSSNGINVFNHTQPPNRSINATTSKPVDQSFNQSSSSTLPHQFRISSPKDRSPISLGPNFPSSGTHRTPNHFAASNSNAGNDRVTDQSVLSQNEYQSEYLLL